MKTLLGLRSRWTMWCSCACASPAQPQLLLPPQHVRERLAVQALHDEEGHGGLARPSTPLGDVEDADDVLVVELRDGPRLPQAHAGQLLAREEELERHHALQLLVPGPEHLAHGALAQRFDDLEPATVRAPQPLPGEQATERQGLIGADDIPQEVEPGLVAEVEVSVELRLVSELEVLIQPWGVLRPLTVMIAGPSHGVSLGPPTRAPRRPASPPTGKVRSRRTAGQRDLPKGRGPRPISVSFDDRTRVERRSEQALRLGCGAREQRTPNLTHHTTEWWTPPVEGGVESSGFPQPA
jgi:hypothetical protein